MRKRRIIALLVVVGLLVLTRILVELELSLGVGDASRTLLAVEWVTELTSKSTELAFAQVQEITTGLQVFIGGTLLSGVVKGFEAASHPFRAFWRRVILIVVAIVVVIAGFTTFTGVIAVLAFLALGSPIDQLTDTLQTTVLFGIPAVIALLVGRFAGKRLAPVSAPQEETAEDGSDAHESANKTLGRGAAVAE